MTRSLLKGLCLLVCLPSMAQDNSTGDIPEGAEDFRIDVIALFSERAMLEIDGERTLLRVGEISDEGVKLVSASSREAVIELGSERFTLDLSSRIGTTYEPPQNATVSISLNDTGQYRTTGSINNRPTTFLVDTGANVLAMNSQHARELGVDLSEGRQTQAVTASGVVSSWEVTLPVVEVGGIRVSNVRAAVLAGSFPQEILLGMTFLRNVEMSESSGVMVLRSKL